MVGAPRFELGTSCAQGRRATRLRYAPTSGSSIILLYLFVLFLVVMTANAGWFRLATFKGAGGAKDLRCELVPKIRI